MSNMQVLYVAEEKKEPHCTLLTSTVAIFLLYPAANVAGSVFRFRPRNSVLCTIGAKQEGKNHIYWLLKT